MITKGKGPRAQGYKSLVYGAICGMGLAFTFIYLIWRFNGGATADLVIRPGIFLLMSCTVALGYWLSDTLHRSWWKEKVLDLVGNRVALAKIADDKLVELAKKVEAAHRLVNQIERHEDVDKLAKVLGYERTRPDDPAGLAFWWKGLQERADNLYYEAVHEFSSCQDDFEVLAGVFDFKLREYELDPHSGLIRFRP